MAHLIAEVIQLILFTDDDFPDNQSSLEFHLKVFTSSVDLRPKSPSECHCVGETHKHYFNSNKINTIQVRNF